MIIPDDIAETAISLKDQYFDLRGLSLYSALGVGTLRDYLKSESLPHYKLRGKILVRRSEFDLWMQNFKINKKKDINNIVDDVIASLKDS